MKRVLIGYSACPLTRAAFEAKGHDVWTCDLLPARDNSRKHYMCDVWEALRLPWDMAVLHPMCTVMAVSSSWALKDPNYEKYPGVGYHQRVKDTTLVGHERRAKQQDEFDNFRRLLALPFPVAIENPAPSMINTAIRPPDQIVHPWMFGDDASKGTGFWLTRGLPKLAIDNWKCVDPRIVCSEGHISKYDDYMESPRGKCPQCRSLKCLPRWANQTDSGQNKLPPGPERWLLRSQTYPGIAAAMGAQWGEWLNRK